GRYLAETAAIGDRDLTMPKTGRVVLVGRTLWYGPRRLGTRRRSFVVGCRFFFLGSDDGSALDAVLGEKERFDLVEDRGMLLEVGARIVPPLANALALERKPSAALL